MKIYPVVHVNTPEQATEQADVAFEYGADGVYLIDHHPGSQDDKLFDTFNAVSDTADRRFIGMNMLGHIPLAAMRRIELGVTSDRLRRAPDALWADDASRERDFGETIRYRDASSVLGNVGYRGGVAFKYTALFTEDPQKAAWLARAFQPVVDVVTTSGEGTGSAPSVEKIAAMRGAVGKLAVASGIGLDNIDNYTGIVDEVLVASSVETHRYSGIFDRPVLRALIERAHTLE